MKCSAMRLNHPTALFADGHEDVVGWVEARRSALGKQHCMARRNPPVATQNGGVRRATPCINEMQCNAAQPTLRPYSLTVTKKRSPRHVEGNAWRSTCPERSGRRSTCVD